MVWQEYYSIRLILIFTVKHHLDHSQGQVDQDLSQDHVDPVHRKDQVDQDHSQDQVD